MFSPVAGWRWWCCFPWLVLTLLCRTKVVIASFASLRPSPGVISRAHQQRPGIVVGRRTVHNNNNNNNKPIRLSMMWWTGPSEPQFIPMSLKVSFQATKRLYPALESTILSNGPTSGIWGKIFQNVASAVVGVVPTTKVRVMALAEKIKLLSTTQMLVSVFLLCGVWLLLPRVVALLWSSRRRRRQSCLLRMEKEAELRLRLGGAAAAASAVDLSVQQQRPLQRLSRARDSELERGLPPDAKQRLQSLADAVVRLTTSNTTEVRSVMEATQVEPITLDLMVLVQDIETLLSAITVTQLARTGATDPETTTTTTVERKFNFYNPFRRRRKHRALKSDGYLDRLESGSVAGLRSFADTISRPPVDDTTPIELTVLMKDLESLVLEAKSIANSQEVIPHSTDAPSSPPPSNLYNPFRSTAPQSTRHWNSGYLGELQGSVNRLSSFLKTVQLKDSENKPVFDLDVLVHDLSTLLANATMNVEMASKDEPKLTAANRPYSLLQSGFQSSEEFSTISEQISTFDDISGRGGQVFQLETLVADMDSMLTATEAAAAASTTAPTNPSAAGAPLVSLGRPARKKPASYAPTGSGVKYQSAQSGSHYLQSLRNSAMRLSSFANVASSAVLSRTWDATDLDLVLLVQDLQLLLSQAAVSADIKQLAQTNIFDSDLAEPKMYDGYMPTPEMNDTNRIEPILQLMPLVSDIQKLLQAATFPETEDKAVSLRAESSAKGLSSYAPTLPGIKFQSGCSGSKYLEDLKLSRVRLASFARAARSTILFSESNEPALDLTLLVRDLKYLMQNASFSTIESPSSARSGSVTQGQQYPQTQSASPAPSNFYNPFRSSGTKHRPFRPGPHENDYLEHLKSTVNRLTSFAGAAGFTTIDGDSVIQLERLVSDIQTLLNSVVMPVGADTVQPAPSAHSIWPGSAAPILKDTKPSHYGDYPYSSLARLSSTSRSRSNVLSACSVNASEYDDPISNLAIARLDLATLVSDIELLLTAAELPKVQATHHLKTAARRISSIATAMRTALRFPGTK